MRSDPETKPEVPLLRTKISIPQLPPVFVHRSRLIKRIDLGVKGPLTLLTAPAGFGKTNLLLEWVARNIRSPKPLSIAWLTLDKEDDTSSRFLNYLIRAFQELDPQLGQEALDFFQNATDTCSELGLTLLLNEISNLPNGIVLVLDDFHVVENSLIHRNIEFLLKHLPRNFHIIIASRNEPALDIALLRAKGWVTEISVDELRFNTEEISLFFFQIMGLQLPQPVVQTLEEHTEGWITPLKLAAISLRNQPDPNTLLANFHGNIHYLMEFLSEEVLSGQPEEVRRFLLCTSILDVLSGPLCEAVVNLDAQPGYGAVMLNRLEHANLFLTAIDDKHEWFRYHPLLADFMRQVQAQENLAEIPKLHKRAALWYERNGNLDEAFRHAMASQDMAWAAGMIERNVSAMINMGEISALARWIGRLPEEITRKHALLGVGYTWALIVSYQLDLARYWLEEVRQAVEQLEKQNTGMPIPDIDLPGIRGGLALCQSYLALLSGDMELVGKFSREAAGYLSEENVYLRSFMALDDSLSSVLSGDTQKTIESLRATSKIARQANNPFVMIIATCEIAIMQMMQGQTSKAWETLQKAQYLATGPEGKSHPLSGFIDIVMGEILFERDTLEEAREYLERGCKAIQSVWYLGSLGGMTSLARLRQAIGDISSAQEIVDEIARMALRSDASQWDGALASGLAVRLAVQRDDLAAAEQWWKKGGFTDIDAPIAVENYPYHIYEYILLSQARFLMVRGQETGRVRDIKQASDLLRKILPQAEGFQRVNSLIQILILQAMAQFELENEQSKKTMLRALALGEPEGYRRFYLDEGWRLAELLRQCRAMQEESGSHLPSLAFIDSLLETIQPSEGTSSPSQDVVLGKGAVRMEDGLPVSLSARELQVLSLIAAGKSNQEISAELYLALNTVKRHAYNIYAKLEVKKRTQAVSKARGLGLIP
ncbi:MAG TPA: LuxR C-terminal-related transcriptional regulator [Terriglobia bacterium]|nr:LuxR C-terminal-related transcriptional regulator [Terriglobia bacterium]